MSTDLAALSLKHLQSVVAIDSQSDEASTAIPTTEGQRVLADAVGAFYEGLGARVERDEHANVIATLPARNSTAAPVAMLIHLDTARGTKAVPSLRTTPWDGSALRFAANPTLQVDIQTYPSAAELKDQTLVHGEGDFPFGLDDKLGLAHLMTLATLLSEDESIPHPELLLIGRPDEEVGRMEAVEGLAVLLAERGVRFGYTIDGILPFEVNVENFNAAGASVWFPSRPVPASTSWQVHLGGVNTHGATAMAEGHRGAPRFGAELVAAGVNVVGFESDALRDCDAAVLVHGDDPSAAVEAIVGPHLGRGASFSVTRVEDRAGDASAGDVLAWFTAFIGSGPGFTLLCEESQGHDGYSAPYRARRDGDAIRLDVRLRDFTPEGLQARIEHVARVAGALRNTHAHQYVNMGPRLEGRPELVDLPVAAGKAAGIVVRKQPIRGGTGVDPFLDAGVPVANLGTGYFAPESEKEFTSLEMMAAPARWLVELVRLLA